MHIAASLLTVMARLSCTTVRLFGASQMCVYGGGAVPPGGGGTVTWQPSPRGWWGTVFPGVGNDKRGGGGVPDNSEENAGSKESAGGSVTNSHEL